jgi:hypothetical protein
LLSLSELGEHRNDPSRHCLTLCVLSSSQSFAGFATVLNRCAFQRRTASDLEEAAPMGIGPQALFARHNQRHIYNPSLLLRAWGRTLERKWLSAVQPCRRGDPAGMQMPRAPPICSSLGPAARASIRSRQGVSFAGIVGTGPLS